MNENKKQPGEAAYEAHRKHFNSGLESSSLPNWYALSALGKEHWGIIERAIRLPLAVQVYEARRSLARLLVTYRSELQGDWYERSCEDSGMKLDAIGFIDGPYKHESATSAAGQEEIEKILKSC